MARSGENVPLTASQELLRTEEDAEPVEELRRPTHGAAYTRLGLACGALLLCGGAVAGISHSSHRQQFGLRSNGVVSLQQTENVWLPVLDSTTGRTYWYNSFLRETTWDDPSLVAPKTYTYNENLGYEGYDTYEEPVPAPAPAPTQPPLPNPEEDFSHGCPGGISFAGVGQVALVNAKWNQPGDPAGQVEVAGGSVIAYMKGRTYFGNTCQSDSYNQGEYLNLQLLGKRITYTTDLSGAGCGCNAALYLTSMAHHEDKSACFDHYCDASSVCSGTCAEVDLQEANRRAWFSTLHMSADSQGYGGGYGFNRNNWNDTTYGPGSSCIDTNRAFQVEIKFPLDREGMLWAMEVRLTQQGMQCPGGVFSRVMAEEYGYLERVGKPELTEALRQGMTPIISYWSQPGVDGMLWMDGPGPLASGPCMEGHAERCGESVMFSNFGVSDI